MARSSRRRGEKMPGVSTKMSCASPSMAMPRMIARVVCTFGLTIVTLAPTSALTRVDLPTFGAPMMATKPQRRPAGATDGPVSGRAHVEASTPSRDSSAAAAACSAARLERPSPSAGINSGSSTATRNSGSWCGPVRAISR